MQQDTPHLAEQTVQLLQDSRQTLVWEASRRADKKNIFNEKRARLMQELLVGTVTCTALATSISLHTVFDEHCAAQLRGRSSSKETGMWHVCSLCCMGSSLCWITNLTCHEVQKGQALIVLGLLVAELHNLVIALLQSLHTQSVPCVLVIQLLQKQTQDTDIIDSCHEHCHIHNCTRDTPVLLVSCVTFEQHRRDELLLPHQLSDRR